MRICIKPHEIGVTFNPCIKQTHSLFSLTLESKIEVLAILRFVKEKDDSNVNFIFHSGLFVFVSKS
jgi:hypothetical protein